MEPPDANSSAIDVTPPCADPVRWEDATTNYTSGLASCKTVPTYVRPAIPKQYPLHRPRGAWRLAASAHRSSSANEPPAKARDLSLIHISEPTRLGMISY